MALQPPHVIVEGAEHRLLRNSVSTHRRGLICGYRLGSCVEPVAVDGSARLEELAPVWLHFNLTDARARKWLEQQTELPSAALSTLLEPQPRVRVELLPDSVAGIIDDLHHDFKGDPEGFGELRFYVDARRVISLRRHPLKTVDILRRGLDAGHCIASTAGWLEQLVEGLAKSFGGAVQSLAEQVDELEDQIVAGQGHARRASLATIRRLLVRFRRHLNADRSELGKLRSRHGDEVVQAESLRHALDHLDGVAQDLDLVHERVRLLQEEVAGLLAEATNRNLYLLSVVTTVLLPTTLVTSIWGMNVGGLPWSHDARGFLWVGLALLGSVVLSLVLLRRTRVL